MSQPSHSASPPLLFQQGRQPITPPPTPPRRHLYPPRYLSHDPSLAPPSPSPSISSSTLSSTRSNRQTEWIYRRPKVLKSSSGSNISIGTSLLSRHRSASINAGQRQSATASCSPQQVSCSPSSCHTATAATCHNLTSTLSSPAKSSSKFQPTTAKPRPSSPVFISSTIQFVDVGTPPASPSGLERNPSICSNLTSRSHGGVYGFASLATSPMSNSSVSNLQLQSLIRVSPLKNRHYGGGGGGGGNNSPMTDSGSSLMTGNQVVERRHSPTTTGATLLGTPRVLEQSPSTTSIMMNRRAGKSMWSAPHSGLGAAISPSLTPVFATRHPENDRILKSIPSQTQISIDSSITPMFVVPSSAASPSLFVPPSNSVYHLKNAKYASEKLSLRMPTRIRHSLSATSTSRTSPSSHPQRDKGIEWRDKFASSPSLPISFMGVNTHQGDASPTVPHLGMKMSPLLLSSSSPPPRLAAENRRRRRRSSSSSSNNTNQNPSKSRDRISSFTSQTSIATATTARTSMTNRTLSSCSTTSSLVNSQCTPITPAPQDPSDFTSKPIPVPRAHYFRRSSSNSTGYTPASYHLHGHGREKKFLLNQSYQRRHQRQGSTNSSVSFDGVGESGNNAAASARSQAYAQLTGNATAAGMGLGLGTIANANVDVGSRPRRPSTSPGSGLSPSMNSSPCGQRHGSGGPVIGSTTCGTSTTMLSPSSPPTYQPHSRLAHSSLISLSHYGNPSSITRTPSRVTSPPYVPSHHFSSLPKTRSILTRASSLSTKASACGGTVKSVKFVEIPEIYYRSGYYEHDGKDFIYGCDTGNTDAKEEQDRADEGQDDIPAVGARGEGQEGMVLRECSGMDIEAIDMDIDTYLGTHKHFAEESKETKYGLKKMGWGFLSRGRKLIEKESRREQEDGMKASIVPLPPFSDQEQRREEKEKTTPGFGLRRLMGLTTRKAPPPPLSLSITSSAPLSPESPNALIQLEEDNKIQPKNNKKLDTSPSVSPRKPISGPYVLGSHLPSRSPSSTHSPMPSPSSPLHQPIPSRSILASSSSTSLNKIHGRPWCGHSSNSPILSSTSVYQGHHHRSRSLRSTHAPNASIVTTVFSQLDNGMNTERPVGPNVAGRTRPKGIVMGADAFQSVNSLIKNASSYESFQSAKSCGGRSDVDSMKSVGAGSMRTFRAWMNKIGTGGGGGGECVAVGRE